ncbi:MAG: hypothetical protein WA892_10545 [Ornithinimicrobium sp.]
MSLDEPGTTGHPPTPASGAEAEMPRQVVITVQTTYQEHIADVCDGLTRHGVVVQQVMAELGMITGTAPDAEHLAAASTVEGVASIDQTIQHQIAPPDSTVQ